MAPERLYLVPDEPRSDSPQRQDRWREGKYLPHYDGICIPQFITFRLHDSIPDHVMRDWKNELKTCSSEKRERILSHRIQRYTDEGYGRCWLEDPDVAERVEESLLFFDEDRYILHAWVIMPNHVHVQCTVIENYDLGEIIHSWKSYIAHKVNRLLEREGSLWGEGYFDRYMRNHEHFVKTVQYIESNPVRAGLCEKPDRWRWSSAWYKCQGSFDEL